MRGAESFFTATFSAYSEVVTCVFAGVLAIFELTKRLLYRNNTYYSGHNLHLLGIYHSHIIWHLLINRHAVLMGHLLTYWLLRLHYVLLLVNRVTHHNWLMHLKGHWLLNWNTILLKICLWMLNDRLCVNFWVLLLRIYHLNAY